MADRQSKFVLAAMQATQQYAKRWFLNKDERDDALSVAWELAQKGKGNAKSIAWYAIRRVRAGRHFAGSTASVDHPKPRGRKPGIRWDVYMMENNDPSCEDVTIMNLARLGDDPAELVGFQIDFDAWRERLPERKRQIVDALTGGMSTSDAAAEFAVSWGRISQIRRELEADWNELFSEA